MDSQQIISICQSLKQEGKEPSVALIKARLGSPVALPVVISGLKMWKSNPEQQVEITEKEPVPKEQQQPLEQRVLELEHKVESLYKLIEQLQKRN